MPEKTARLGLRALARRAMLDRGLEPPVEGKLEVGHTTVEVGDQIRVQLASLNVQRGFIDFVRADKAS